MFSCARCGENATDGTTCCLCKHQFDFACAGITEIGFRKLGDRKKTWRCSDCKSVSSSVAPSHQQVSQQLSEMRSTLDSIIRQLAPLATLVEDVKTIKQDISDLKVSDEYAQKTADKSLAKFDSLESRITRVEENVNVFHIVKADLDKFKEDLQDKEQWARANNVEIKGVPLTKSENLYDIVGVISKTIKCSVRKEEINYIARVPSLRSDSSKTIIMALNNCYLKEEFVAAARKHKSIVISDLGFKGDGKVFVNDHLTPYNKALLKIVKDVATESNFRYVWVKHCKILVRKSDTSPIFRIRTEKDIIKFFRKEI
ncbi:unnamed protein product [Arctia plantaginis]|uniref:FP protein C-terminal domain-containing protein n=1 Tax=Arctia plantaginis TaxID=874455 RepID=A0A8S0YY24_ARCPL|nr:unnamed protein product [Arctia plantaginis]